MAPKSDPTISAPVDIGDRGVPALVKDSNSKYATPELDASGNLKISGTVTATVDTSALATSAKQLPDGHAVSIKDSTGTAFSSSNPLSTNVENVLPVPIAISDLDSNDRLPTAPISGQNGVQGGSGVVTALTQRMVLATDVALPAGTNNIGDVDVLSIAAGTNVIGKARIVTANGDEVTDDTNDAVKVVQSDATKLNVTEASASAIKTAVEAIESTSGIKKITDALPAGTNLLGKFGIDQVTANANEVVVKSGSVTIGANSTVDVNKIAGTATSVNNGAVDAGTQRVTIANNSTGTVAVTQSTASSLNCTEASASAIKTSVEIMDDWDESDRAKVNPIAGQAGVQGGSGTVSNTTQRVVLATDVALPAGTNLLGSLHIQDASTTDKVQVCARTQTPTGNAMQVQIGPGDVISNLPVVIQYDHHQIHEGESHRWQDVQASLGTGTVKYGLTVPTYAVTIRCPHLINTADVYNGTVLVQLYEGATFTNGSLVTAYNRNRNSATTPGLTVTTGVTSTNGTLIDSFYVGSGSRSASSNRASVEWVLKSNTIYRVDVIGQVAGTACIIGFDSYEDLGV